MLPNLLTLKETLFTKNQHLKTYWLIAGLLAVVMALELSTPPAYVFGYLYIEQEILALIAAGKSNQEIGEILYIAAGTVRVHVHAILQKLEVRDGFADASRTHSSGSFGNPKGLVAPELLA